MNLLDEDRSRVFGKADAIFCRNVLIYFDARARKTAIEVLYDRLQPRRRAPPRPLRVTAERFDRV